MKAPLPRSRRGVRGSDSLHQAVLDAMSARVCVLDDRGMIILVNQAWREFAGAQPGAATRLGIGGNYFQACEEVVGMDSGHLGEMLRSLGAVGQGEEAESAQEYGCWEAGEWRWHEMRVTRVAEGGERRLVVVHRDVSVRKRMEEALRESQARLAFLLRSTPAVTYTARADGDFDATYISENVTAITGHAPREFLEVSGFWLNQVHPEDRARVLDEVGRLLERGEARMEYRFRRRDGTYRWIEDAVRVVRDERGDAVELVGHWQDIHVRRQAEEDRRIYAARLRALSRSLVEAQEAERRRVSRELHDEIGQALTLMKIGLDTLPGLPRERLEERFAELSGQLGRLIDSVRTLSLELRPSMLDDLGLMPAFLWLFDRLGGGTGMDVVFEHAGVEEVRFDPGVEIAAYRIVQEALTNILRHAGATRIHVRLQAGSGALRLEVEDDGRGFDPAAALASCRSVGIQGMQERAEALAGELSIVSVSGRGTRVRARLPLPPETDAQGGGTA